MWEKVEWTDESRFTPFTNDGRQRIRQEQHEALHPNCTQPVVQARDDDGICKDDDATPHRAQTVQTWFYHYHDIFHYLKWPSKSQDIRVFRNLWDELERHLR
ncbi:hypothetical protein TNCV_3581451 [Trichonephila clavipes]|nr:hypothetical protein TNCV_3581451 [Trichonephila clavipes]